MSASGEDEQFSPVTPGAGGAATPGEQLLPEDQGLVEGQLPGAMFRDDPQARAVALRAEQPAGAVFALGWVMAELFDARRQVSAVVHRPPFDPQVQLPQVADLTADPKLVFLAAELAEYLHWFPRLSRPLRRLTTQAGRKRRAVSAENLAAAEAAAQASGGPTYVQADDVATAEAATAAVAVRQPFAEPEFLAAVTGLHQAILEEFADDAERLSAYQLGLALSDLVWLPSSPSSPPSTLLGLFARSHLTTVQTLLNGAGTQLPSGSATIVSRSLDNWADWIDVNSARVAAAGTDTWSQDGDVTLRALRAQGWVWRSVLVADPEVAVQPAIGAWEQAASSIARAAGKTSLAFLIRFWPLVVIALAALAGLLYLVISNLSGVSQVWASLVTVAAVLGGGSWSLGSGVSAAFDAVGSDIWTAAKLDAGAWNITWLPALSAGPAERIAMERRGVAMPQLRKSLDS
jgi:hypothetical protein